MCRSQPRINLAAVFLLPGILGAAEHHGIVRFGGLPVPGATVTATSGDHKSIAITDQRGAYSFVDLADGRYVVQVEMQLFATERREVTVPSAPAEWELNPLPQDATPARIVSQIKPPAPAKPKPAAPKPDAAKQPAPDTSVPVELAQRAADGLLINGSVNNGAASPFAQLPAFGNFRRGPRSLYNGNLGLIVNNSSFDARAFSLTGQATPKPAYSRVQALFAFGGPVKIPKLIERNGPILSLNYQWTRNSNANTQTGLMPVQAERNGEFSRLATDPLTGLPFPNNQVPASRIATQAQQLLALYPLPNFTGSTRYNFQIPIVSGMHQDDLQTRVNKQVRRNFFGGAFSVQSTRSDNPNLFGFLNTSRVLGFNASSNFRHNFSPRSFVTLGYQLSRFRSQANPFFANRHNVSGAAGISGNNQDPENWGPPALQFASGITALGDVQSSLVRNQTSGLNGAIFMSRDRHNLHFGGAYRRQQFNVLSQQDPRGTFTFTGAAATSDFAGFLMGVPDTSSIAFGNADKYLRASIMEGFANDDWRVNPGLTVNYGVRWEYWSPATEKYGRLVNLDSDARPVIGSGLWFPRPDRNNLSPRIGISWRPFPASSLVIRAGYGIYFDTSVYQGIAMQMAQQAPLSKSLRIANTAATPLTLANGFPAVTGSAGLPTFAVDPDFRNGYSQNWQMSLQRDLRGGLQMTAAYAGGKGTRAQQQFLPNTFPAGSATVCADCPTGFTMLVSNGNSIRHSGQLQLRRRLRSGFTAEAQYTFAKSLDNATLGGRGQGGWLVAQDWLNLGAERGRSNFDQRHLLTASVQYTTGMGLRGGALATGWAGRLLKEWTFGSQMTRGTGLPLTPVIVAPVRGTGVTGSIRPDYTGVSIYAAPAGLHLNPAAIASPAAGHWGNAGRNSITGPGQFVLNATMARTFRSTDRVSVDLRLEAANALNTVTFPSWNTIAGNAQFGLPNTANAMRTLQAVLRMRF